LATNVATSPAPNAPGLSRWLVRAGRPLLETADLIVPVPLHRSRLWWRRYNQSAELARAIGRVTGKRLEPLALARKRPTPSQGAMASAKARRRNMLGAFAIGSTGAAAVKGTSVLLVDDVLTTGATVEACARVLKRAGASPVAVLTLARVVRPLTGVI
jgi:ComF family protein